VDPNQVSALDRLAFKIVEGISKVFGLQYKKGTEHYIYVDRSVTALNYAVGQRITGSIRITQEADFVCTRTNVGSRFLLSGTPALVGAFIGTSSSTAVAGDWPDPAFRLQITDGGTDRELHSEPVDAFVAYGTNGGLPGIWSKPRLFDRNSNIKVTYELLKPSAAGDQLELEAQFIGWKIYDVESQDLTSRRP